MDRRHSPGLPARLAPRTLRTGTGPAARQRRNVALGFTSQVALLHALRELPLKNRRYGRVGAGAVTLIWIAIERSEPYSSTDVRNVTDRMCLRGHRELVAPRLGWSLPDPNVDLHVSAGWPTAGFA